MTHLSAIPSTFPNFGIVLVTISIINLPVMGDSKITVSPSRFELSAVKQSLSELELGFDDHNEMLRFYSKGKYIDKFYYVKLCLKTENSQVGILSDGLILYLSRDHNEAVIRKLENVLERSSKKTKKRTNDTCIVSSAKKNKGALEMSTSKSFGGISGSASRSSHLNHMANQVHFMNLGYRIAMISTTY